MSLYLIQCCEASNIYIYIFDIYIECQITFPKFRVYSQLAYIALSGPLSGDAQREFIVTLKRDQPTWGYGHFKELLPLNSLRSRRINGIIQ